MLKGLIVFTLRNKGLSAANDRFVLVDPQLVLAPSDVENFLATHRRLSIREVLVKLGYEVRGDRVKITDDLTDPGWIIVEDQAHG